MSDLSRALAAAAHRLEPVSDTPMLDAQLLLGHSLGIERAQMLIQETVALSADFERLLDRRLAGEPIAYIVGKRAFWTIELEVTPDVLIPRPDSETLIEAAVAHFKGTAGPARVLDLGCGSGALLLAALNQWPKARGLGIDRSEAALAVAQRNAHRLGMADRAELRAGHWADGITERFDLLLCNPPYVALSAELGRGVAEHEPPEALYAGEDGLDELRAIAPQIPRLLAPDGLAAIEIGSDQTEAAKALLGTGELTPRLAHDLAGRPRAILVTFVR